MLPGDVAVIGAGTLGLLTIAALRHLGSDHTIIATAKHPLQQRLAPRRSAPTDVVAPNELAARRPLADRRRWSSATNSRRGVSTVVDCVGSDASIQQALARRRARRRGRARRHAGPTTQLDLTGLWHRESSLRGCYAYTRDDFDRAIDARARPTLGRLVTATYPLARYRDAIEHAANAGARGAVKVAFDLRAEKERNR